MKINGKEYATVEPASIKTWHAKLLVLLSQSYDQYITSDEVRGDKYAKLKDLWKQTVEALVKEPSPEIKDFDNIDGKTYSEVVESFFPPSSEVKK